MFDTLTPHGWNLKRKVILAFALTALLVAATGVVGFVAVSTVYDNSNAINTNAETVDTTKELLIAIEQEQVAIYADIAGEPGAREEFETAASNFDRWADEMNVERLDGEQRQLFTALEAKHAQYTRLSREVFNATQAGDIDRANTIIETQLDPLSVEMRGMAYSLQGLALENKRQATTQVADTAETTQRLVLLLSAGAFGAAILIGLFVSNRLTEPVNQLSASAISISEGDFSTEIDEYHADDEIGRMVEAFGEMRTNLEGVFAELDAISQHLQQGDLDHEIDTDYPGTYGEIMHNIDESITQLTASFDEIRDASENLRAGELDYDIDTDRPGEYGAVLSDLEGDLAQQRDRERELQRQKDQLEDFATIVAHDLRNPLTVARGRITLLEDEYTNPTAAPHFDAIQQAHTRMETLIDDILSLARAGQPIGEKEWVDVSQVARDAWATIDAPGMTLQTTGHFEVKASRERLQQLLENLFGNANAYAGDEVTISVGSIEAMPTTTRDSTANESGFFVADDGSGFDEGQQSKVFKPGYTTDDSGTGYGLWIVQTIANAHGWRVSVTESETGGARFEVTGARVREHR
ncbi:sensor histidine kinase [Halapricum desulfuricans]|uniref:histidine kinase n=1 Tax=Halapricum desulfuricans TaxID=2841257 RepID=A0A897NHG9_9EURY|nr:HAMP domain-containing protein [Halapricum desulfuricans]QSG10339.1 Methyl-accepting chemotaxis protein [Halapricum desulfuricans]